MKGYELKGNDILRNGEPIATILETGLEYLKPNLKPMVNKYLKSQGLDYLIDGANVKVEWEGPKIPIEKVEATSDTLMEQLVQPSPDPLPVKGITVLPSGPELPRGVSVEHPPKERVVPGHKATLYFNKDGRGRKLALYHVPTNEEVIEIIDNFRS